MTLLMTQSKQSQKMSFLKRKHAGFLLFCLFVVMIGYGLTLPVLGFYIERLALAEGATSRNATFHVGLLTGIFAFMQFFFAPLWGRLSDRAGRRPLFMIGLVMAVAQAGAVGWLIGQVGEKLLLPPGFVLMGGALFLLMMTREIALILFYVSLFAIGMALINPSLSSLVSKNAGELSGTALGMQNAVISLGQTAGPVIGGLLFIWNVHVPYLLTALMLTGTAITLGIKIWPKNRRY